MFDFTKNIKPVFYIYVGALALLSVLPLNTDFVLNDISIVSFRGDYFLHAVTFFPWAFFNLRFGKNNLLWLFTGLLFSFSVEGLQYMLPYRSFNINDLLANGLGVVTGHVILFVKALWVGVSVK